QHLHFNTGGLQNQIQYTKESLERLGHEVIFLEDWLKHKPKIDLCHQFSLHPTLINTFNQLLTLKIPIIISSVYNEIAPPFFNRLAILSSRVGIPILYYKDIIKMIKGSSHMISLGELETNILNKSFGPIKNISSLPNGIYRKF